MMQSHTKPGRFRPILTMVLITIILVLAWLGLEVYFAFTAKPNPTIDFGQRAEELVESVQSDLPGEDVWPVLMEATQLFGDTLVDLKDDETGIEWNNGNYSFDAYFLYDKLLQELKEQEAATGEGFFKQEQYDQLEAHKRMSERAISVWDEKGLTRRLDEVAASGKAVRPMMDTTQQIMIEMLLPELGTLRNMARALRARMVLARNEQDWSLYAESLEHGLAIGRIEMAQSTLIDRLVGVAIRSLMFTQLQEDLVEKRLPAEALEGVKAAIDRQSRVAPVTHAFDAELLMQLDALQWTHDRRGRIILSRVRQLDFSGGQGPAIMNLASIVLPRQIETENWFRAFNERVKAEATLPVAERIALERKGQGTGQAYESTWRTVIQDLLVPAYGSAIRSDDQLQLQELGTRVMLAIEQYRLASGAFPEALSDLAPQWLSESATDPYSPDGTLLGYRVIPAAEGTAASYVLYSVGYDGEDNEGTAPEKNMPDALRNGYAGTDYLFTETIR